MQFSNKIDVIFNVYNDFGEEQESRREEIKCKIMYHAKKLSAEEKSKTKNYDMKIVVACKEFSPYNQLLSDDALVFEYEDVKYSPIMISSINNFSGKTKYYEIELRQVK